MEVKHYNLKSVLLFFIIFLFIVSCTSQSNDCGATKGDILKVVDQQSHNETNYFLVHRVSGFQDKVVSLELYDREPDFDQCSESRYSTVFANSADYDDRPITGLKVNTDKQKFEIVYGSIGDKDGAVKLIFKN